MLLIAILQFLLNILNWIIRVLPTATTLPLGTDQFFVNGIGYIRFFMTVFPPLGTLLTAFAWYISFIITLKIIQMIPIIRHILN